MVISKCTYKNNFANTGGVIYAGGYVDLTIKLSEFNSNFALLYGGIIYYAQSSENTPIYSNLLTIDSCNFYDTLVYDSGGLMSFNNPELIAKVNNCTISNTTARDIMGGIAFISQAKVFNITKSYIYTVSSKEGSIISSTSNVVSAINLKTNTFQCSLRYQEQKTRVSLLKNLASTGSAFYIFKAIKVYSEDNLY